VVRGARRFGIVLAANSEGYYVVEDTLAGYAAATSGHICAGDVFVSIDHISVLPRRTPHACCHL
jgi:C-terminal processing protease CtpA/Prc